MTGRAPFNGPLIVRISDQEHHLGDEVCSRIWVVPPHSASADEEEREEAVIG